MFKEILIFVIYLSHILLLKRHSAILKEKRVHTVEYQYVYIFPITTNSTYCPREISTRKDSAFDIWHCMPAPIFCNIGSFCCDTTQDRKNATSRSSTWIPLFLPSLLETDRVMIGRYFELSVKQEMREKGFFLFFHFNVKICKIDWCQILPLEEVCQFISENSDGQSYLFYKMFYSISKVGVFPELIIDRASQPLDI